jgi:predicted  nucleic acid-binding Zn-ribbon protein
MAHSADEIIEAFAIVAPYFNEVTTEDMGITVIKDGVYIAYQAAESLNFNSKIGEPIKGKVALDCLATGRKIFRLIGKEQSAYGIPYVACAYPIKDGDRVVGCITTTQTATTHERLSVTAENLAAASEEMSAGLEEVSAHAQELASISKELGVYGKELEDVSRRSNDIISIIKSTASQTNLLGLNATIEAARVGEMGRGFGVVAEEVRKLADATSKSVVSINESLEQIRQVANAFSSRLVDADNNVTQQSNSVRELATASQNLAEMATQLAGIAQNYFKLTEE